MKHRKLSVRSSLTTLGVLVASMTLFAPGADAEQFDIVSCRAVNANVTECRIDRPNPKQPRTNYPQVAFRGGDAVTVHAGGCVQTGGRGQTWKSYTHPQGSDSGRLYSGTILIPGATPGDTLVRIGGWIDKRLPIPHNAPPSHLSLGYQDDGYGDNGYYSHDNGNNDQCKGVGAAWVTVTIEHNAAPTTQRESPLDLAWDLIDDNELPLNPKWGYQLAHNNQAPNVPQLCGLPNRSDFGLCSTQQPTRDTADGWNAFVCHTLDSVKEFFAGGSDMKLDHYNWFNSTYSGTLTWDSHSSDDDYNFYLLPDGGGGVTTANCDPKTGCQIGLEFDSDETIDHFNSNWWNTFHRAVDGNNTLAASMVHGKRAIVVGLVGLDCEHSCYTEIHPVQAMAIEVDPNPNDNHWAIFVRNAGDEGYCSQDEHFLETQSLTFRLPRKGANSVAEIAPTQFRSNNPAARMSNIHLVPNEGALVTFQLPPYSAHGLVDGELVLRWGVSAGAPQHPQPQPQLVAMKHTGDTRHELLTSKMTTQQRATFESFMKRKTNATVAPQSHPLQRFQISGPPPRTGKTPKQLYGHGHSANMDAKGKHHKAAVCAAYNKQIPGHPHACD
jgi:hypothetical protein